MNWTSTKVPMWQLDCQNFWRAGSIFEVRDVTSEEDLKFIEIFARSHDLSCKMNGSIVSFSAPDFSSPGPIPPGEGAYSGEYA